MSTIYRDLPAARRVLRCPNTDDAATFRFLPQICSLSSLGLQHVFSTIYAESLQVQHIDGISPESGEMVVSVDELIVSNEGPPLSKEELDELIIHAQHKLAEKHALK